MSLSPILLFTYNRPWHTEQTLSALKANDLASQSQLYIFCDGPKKDSTPETIKDIEEVREIVSRKRWCEKTSVVLRDENIGLANSIIDGVTTLLEQHEYVIVLEDDIVPEPGFLKYMNDSLEIYKTNNTVGSIAGYADLNHIFCNNDIYFQTKGTSWGWATWKRVWREVEWNIDVLIDKFSADPNLIKKFNYGGDNFYQMLLDQKAGKIDSWAIRFYASCFLKEYLHLTPTRSIVRNIGFDGSGTHSTKKGNVREQKRSDFIKVCEIKNKPDTFPDKILRIRKKIGLR